jgi:hypothetical protein
VTQPVINTTPSPSSISLGSSFADTATVSGGNSPTGTVSFTVYSDAACSSVVFTSSNVALVAGSATSASYTPTATGTFYIAAVYNGDSKNNSVTSTCNKESVVVTKPAPATPTISTTPSPSSITLGNSFADTATVSGGNSPTGTVSFTVYSDAACSNVVFTSSNVGLVAGSATSASYTPTATGTFYIAAVYNGDTNNSSVTSTCNKESVIVSKPAPSTPLINTTPSPSAVSLGNSFADTATVSGGNSPTGTVSFTVYSNSACSSVVFTSSNVALVAGSATSASYTPTATGTFYIAATYNGDANNNSVTSTCNNESVVVTQPVINTTPSPSSITLGDNFADTATVSGGSSPTGTVSFTIYSDAACSNVVFTSPNIGLVAGSATSASYTPSATGTFYIAATYNGDANNNAVTSPCSAESVVVTAPGCTANCGGGGGGPPPSASLSTVPNVAGSSATDTATVKGTAGTPTGTVTFILYSGAVGSGTIDSSFAADTVTLNGSGSATSASTGTLAFGSYYFLVTYAGDATYGAITPGTPEPFTINPDLSTIPTVTGTTAIDTATVTGTLGTPTGTVTFTLYSGSPGHGTQVASFTPQTVTLSGGTAASTSTGSLTSGDYYFMVSYSGDATYAAITPGLPEPFTIIATNPSKPPKYKIPTSAPQTGAGGMAGVTFNGGLLAMGSLLLLAGLSAIALMLRRRRTA